MSISENQQILLKKLPGVDYILELIRKDSSYDNVPRSVVTASIRTVIENLREQVLSESPRLIDEDFQDDRIYTKTSAEIIKRMTLNLRRTVNGAGVVVHTNLGRSLLSDEAIQHVTDIAKRYSNLEFNIQTGKRGLRYSAVEELICEISGAEAALVVNNNAGAVLLSLDTVAKNREVIVSRGELVEIGGSFRIPDVMAKSGGILKEVGTTNRTHLKDYEAGVTENTGLLLKVHTSNYSVVGFTASVSLEEMVKLGRKSGIPVMDDLGSGTFIDFSKYGLPKEPTVQDSVSAGVDIVTFSGDKLLGGPQAGIITGKKKYIDAIKKNPLTRALRVDKMTLAALESTLRLYRDEEKAVQQIPTLRMLTMKVDTTQIIAERIVSELETLNDSNGTIDIRLLDLSSRAGGGSLPLLDLPSKCVGISIVGMSANKIERRLRLGAPSIIGRIEDNIFIIDPRTIQDDEPALIKRAFEKILKDKNNEKTNT